jgi:FlaA1/EpsC-like NDP-sugar epimerase
MHGVSAVFHLKLIATEDVDPEQRIRQMRIFLTGASGSIGRVVTERALTVHYVVDFMFLFAAKR